MSGSRIYPASVWNHEFDRLQLERRGWLTRRIGRVNAQTSAVTSIAHPTGFCFEIGQVVQHKESGHLAEVIGLSHAYHQVVAVLRWLTIDWRESKWAPGGFGLAPPLEALARQAS